MLQFTNSLDSLMLQKKGKSRCINQENPKGEKGKGGMAAGSLGAGRKGSPCMQKIIPGETRVLAEMEGPGVIQHIWMTVTDRTEKDYYVLRDLVLRIYWDDEEEPSVESPLGDFFCCGFARECLVNSLPIVVNPSRGFNSYFQMPFRKKARITLENQHEAEVPAFFYQVDYTLSDHLWYGNRGLFWRRLEFYKDGKWRGQGTDVLHAFYGISLLFQRRRHSL